LTEDIPVSGGTQDWHFLKICKCPVFDFSLLLGPSSITPSITSVFAAAGATGIA